jgi:hypothetical protein
MWVYQFSVGFSLYIPHLASTCWSVLPSQQPLPYSSRLSFTLGSSLYACPLLPTYPFTHLEASILLSTTLWSVHLHPWIQFHRPFSYTTLWSVLPPISLFPTNTDTMAPTRPNPLYLQHLLVGSTTMSKSLVRVLRRKQSPWHTLP